MTLSLSPNLMVSDLQASLAFYVDGIGGQVAFTLDAEQNADMSGGIIDDAVFASLRVGSSEMMLQQKSSLMADVPGAFPEDVFPGGTISVYFRVDDVAAVLGRLGDIGVVTTLDTTWSGMQESWLRDPGGYLVAIGAPDGDAPEV